MIVAFNNGNNSTANVLLVIAAVLFGIAALIHLFSGVPRATPAEAGHPGYFGWTPALVDAGLCLVAIALAIS